METLNKFYDVENQRENTEDIENSIHNSLLYNRPTVRQNCYEFCLHECSALLPFGIAIIVIIIVMIIVVIVVKNLF